MTYSHRNKSRGNRGTQGLYFYRPGRKPPPKPKRWEWWQRLRNRLKWIFRDN